jgi:iron complex outermembrane receptor protein
MIKRTSLLVTATLLATQPAVGVAQNANDGPMIEEVTVTAQRRAERLQDVPIAVTAFTAAELEARGIGSTRDILPMTPNVTYDESFTVGNSFVSVRGVAQINNADSPVAIVVDGVPQNSQKQLRMELFDVERIEVLKGPQGALYGRNAIGGAINIVTREPSNEFDGWAQVGAGSGNLRSASGAISGPVVEDKLLFRLSSAYKDSDGNIENTFLRKKVDFYESKDIRARFMILATDALTIDLRGSFSDIDGGAVMDSSMDPALTGNANRKVLPRSDILGTSAREISDATVKLDWHTDIGTLTAITGYTDLAENYYGDLDFCNPLDCPAGIFGLGPQADQRQRLDVTLLSQEVRLASPDDQRLRWIVGGFYLATERNLDTLAHLLVPGMPGIPLIANAEENDNEAYSVFAQVDYDITDRTTLGFSLRYDRDEREQTNAGDPVRPTRSKSFSDVQPRVVIDHKLNGDQLIYATYATGFRSGGFNGVGGRPFDAETLRNYEIGYKSTWWDHRLRLNAAVFQSRSEDYQFFYIDFDQGGAQVIDNLDKVEFTGAELEWQLQATRYWTLLGAVGLLDSDIKSFDPTLTVPAERGNRTPKTQKSTFSLGSQLQVPLGSLTGTLRIDYGRWGKKYWHPDNIDVRDPVNMLDLRVSIGNERWTATAWGRNVLDEFYWQDFNAVEFGAPGVDLGSASPPDTYGIELKYQF